jgi:hypothetical protein
MCALLRTASGAGHGVLCMAWAADASGAEPEGGCIICAGGNVCGTAKMSSPTIRLLSLFPLVQRLMMANHAAKASRGFRAAAQHGRRQPHGRAG